MSDVEDDISEFLDSLSEEELETLKRRFGPDFSGGTNQEILAALMGITRDKIHRIEQKALRKLKNKGDDPDDTA